VAVSTDLLRRLRSLDDLIELAATLGYRVQPEELNGAARERLGLSAGRLSVERATVLARMGPFVVYGVVMADAARELVAGALERLSHHAPGERPLLFALDASGAVLAAAATGRASLGGRPAARQLRVSTERPSRVAAEILGDLRPRPGETALSLSIRVADVLAEEGLTSRFFREFARHHARLAERLAPMPRATTEDRRDLALVVMTRVLFLYFVQAKGWLGSRRNFIAELLDASLKRGRPFHASVFEPLCFGALNTPYAARGRPARELGEVPFMNGGLFERHGLERRFPSARLADDGWRDLIDDLFGRFRFTVRERDDEDAVDPEMLGRVFEGLMSRERRRGLGTYFTPRELLEAVVGRALDALDRNALSGARPLRVLDPAVGSGAFLLETLRQLERRLPPAQGESLAARRRAIVRDSLFGVDVDPMAVRLAELRLWLALVVDDDADWRDVTPLPNLDQNLRQGDSLLSPLDFAGAGPLRAAARLKVAEQRAAYYAATGRDKARLAGAIRAAERGLALECVEAGIAALKGRLADAASAAGRDLFGDRRRRPSALERRAAEWRRRRRALVAVRRRIAEHDALPFFSYEVHLAHALGGGGFDVVLGNPPWVRGERLPQETRRLLESRYVTFRPAAAGRSFAHLPDLSVAFVERALELVRPGGVVAMVLPAKLLRAGYARALRAMLRNETTVVAVEDRSHAGHDGFGATVFPMVAVIRRSPSRPEQPAQVRLAGASGRAMSGLAAQRDLSLDSVPSAAPWLVMPGDVVRALRSVLRAGPRLGSRFSPRLGVKTGANEVFVRQAARADELPRELRRPAALGRDVSPFAVRATHCLLAALDSEGRVLARVPAPVAAYLAPFHGRLQRRADAKGAPPWALFRTDLLRSRWLVVWPDIAAALEAAVLDRREPLAPVPLNTCYGIAAPDEQTACWLAAWLNSGPIRTLAAAFAERASGGCFRFQSTTVGALPLPPHPETHDVLALAFIGREARRGQGWDQDELDHHAERALGLDPDAAALLRHLADTLRRDPARSG
jgi:methylase of polypeptide subunit release factors